MRDRVAACIAVVLLWVPGGAVAQVPSAADTAAVADSVWQMGMAPVVVTATRAERQADEVSGSVSVIDHPTRACPLIIPDRADAETTASAPTSR